MDKQDFAKSFGFYNFEELLNNSQLILAANNASWYISKLPHGKFLTWSNR